MTVNRNVTLCTLLGVGIGYLLCLWLMTNPGVMGEAPEKDLSMLQPQVERVQHPQLTAEVHSLWDLLKSRAEETADRRIERRESRWKEEFEHFSTKDIVAMAMGRLSAEKLRFVSLIVGAIAMFVIAVIKAIIIALIIKFIWSYFLSHWVYFVGAWLVTVLIPSWVIAKFTKDVYK